MNKYDKKIINAYIKGEDIKDYTIEELENDSKFMKMVIAKTRDKLMYELCSDELKKDPNFIKYIIIIFNSDIDFICQVMDEFIKTATDVQTFTELILLMCKYTKSTNNNFNKYEKYRDLIYLDFKVKVEQVKQEYKGTELEQEIGMGFIFIYDYYNHSDITLNYFATNFLIDIFEDYNIDLEELIHNNFTKFKDLEDYGITKYLLNLIHKYDPSLVNYVTIYKKLLTPLQNKVQTIKEEWDLYPEKKQKKQYELMIDKVFDYVDEIKNSTLVEVELLYYIGAYLGIAENIKKYDTLMTDEIYELIISNMEARISSTVFNVYDIKYINDIQNIMIETLELKDINKDNLKQKIMKKVLIKTNKQDN